MSDAQSDGMFLIRSERDAAEREIREAESKLQERTDLLASIERYLQTPTWQTFSSALRNLKKKMPPKKASDLLKGLKAQNKFKWAWFLSYVTEAEWFEKFKKMSIFKDHVIAIGSMGYFVGSSEVTFRTNKSFESYLRGQRRNPLHGDFLVIFDKRFSVLNIKIQP